jgi:hypothetical protein
MRLSFAIVAAAPSDAPQLAVVEIAPGIHEIPSARVPGRGPHGNTTIVDTPECLIVIDTGRHAWESDHPRLRARATAPSRPPSTGAGASIMAAAMRA